jgi:hypothetical protein
MDDFRTTGSTYVGGARSEGGDVSRKKATASGCPKSRSHSGLGRYDCFRRCRSENRR